MAKVIGVLFSCMIVYVLILCFTNITESYVMTIREFFFHSTLGIIALICGALAVVFFYVSAKMPKRIRESSLRVKSVTPALSYTALRNEYDKTNSKLQTKKSMKQEIQEKVIDMEVMTLDSFFKDVAFTLNKPSPVIFKGWGNKRLELDAERVQILGDYISNVRDTCDQYLKLRADMFFSKEKFEHYVEANRMRATGDLDLIREEYKDTLWNKKHERKLKEADLEDRKIAQEERRALIKEQESRTEFFTMAIKKYPDMPAPLQAYMFTQVHGRYPDAKRDFDIEEKINEYVKKKYELEIENMKYDTIKNKEESKTFTEKMKNEREKYK